MTEKTYAETRQSFLDRCAAILPKPLHATFILDEIGDSYPEIHTAERDYVCANDSHDEIKRKTLALTTREIIEILCTKIPDAIIEIHCEIAEPDDDDVTTFTQRDSDEIIDFAKLIDPSESNIAAEIRDTIRDNFDIPNLHI